MKNLNVHIIASSSKGNCVVINDGTSSLLLDAGLRYNKIRRSTDMGEVEAALITHHHLDHCLAVPELVRRGVPVYMSWGEWREMRMDAPVRGMYFVRSEIRFETENWIVVPFQVDHDTPESVGYLIESKATGAKIVYSVDMPAINYDFTGVTHWLLEANYAGDILDYSGYKETLKDRVRRSHMSIENLIAFLKSSDLSKTKEIWLLHLSDQNSNETQFIKQLQEATGVPVYTDTDFLPQSKPSISEQE